MSHQATNWAVQQRGLPPATKLVLWHLADRHNPDYGCFPSQEQLAYDAECSRSALNDHLRRLEDAGLIRRVRSIDPKTRRQLNTRYILGFEVEFAQKPCAKIGHGDMETESEHKAQPCAEIGHGFEVYSVSDFGPEPCPKNAESRVRISDTNPVREPLREPVREEEERGAAQIDDLLDQVRAALGICPASDGQWPIWWRDETAAAHIRGWIDRHGLSTAAVVAAAEAWRRGMPQAPDGPKALDRAMARAARASAEIGGARDSRRKRSEPEAPAMTEAERLDFLADWINGEKFLPQSAISTASRNALVGSGRVTAQRMRERGIY